LLGEKTLSVEPDVTAPRYSAFALSDVVFSVVPETLTGVDQPINDSSGGCGILLG